MLSYFLKNFRVTFLVAIGLAVLGLQAMTTLPRESTPEVTIPIGIVLTVYPGASAIDIEELVTKPVETSVEGVEGVSTVTSSSRLGVSSVTVEFNANENVDDALQRLREAVSGITDIPTDAESPRVIEIAFENEPVISLSLSGSLDKRLLTLYADDLAEELEGISGVSTVSVVGGIQDEVQIAIDPNILVERGLSISQVTAAIAASNVSAPLGQIETGSFGYDVRLDSGFSSPQDISDIVVTNQQGNSFRLSDIATITKVVEEASSASYVSINGEEAETAVTLQVRKRTGGNIVAIVDEVAARAEAFTQEHLPESVSVTPFADRAADIRRSLSDVIESGIQTFIIVFLILSLFLGWKEAAIASLAVPFTFAIAFLVFEWSDITLNGISLFSLILSLGLLVDTAIVIVESIHERAKTKPLIDAADDTVHTFVKPLTAGVLTTVAAFFPMLLVSGIIGQFLRTIPIVLSASLLASLGVALLILPAIAVAILGRWQKTAGNRRFDEFFDRFQRQYEKVLAAFARHRRYQNFLILALVALFFVSLSLPATGLLKTALFPQADVDFILGNVELPPAASLDQTEAVMKDVGQLLRSHPSIESFSLNSGSGTTIDLGGGASGSNIGSFFINLRKDRDRSSIEVSQQLRTQLATITEAEIDILDVSAGPPTAAPIEARVIGNNLDELREGARAIERYLQNVEGVVEIDSSASDAAGELVLRLDNEQMATFGLSSRDVAGTIRQLVFGGEVTSYLDANGDEVLVKTSLSSDATPDSILETSIVNQRGESVRLAQVASLSLESGLTQINRRDGEREITVSANVTPGTNANLVSQKLAEEQSQLNLPASVELRIGGEQQETEETFAELYRSMILAVLAIAGILVIEFNSYRQPLLIILSIPLALVGVLFGLLVTGGSLNFAAFIGLVSLAGIVVNNAILLVDAANTNMAEGKSIEDAMREAAHSRLRPIVLTTLTTAAGVAPLIFVDEFFRDMALTIITGLLFSSILTLLLIPVLYIRQQQKMERKRLRKLSTSSF